MSQPSSIWSLVRLVALVLLAGTSLSACVVVPWGGRGGHHHHHHRGYSQGPQGDASVAVGVAPGPGRVVIDGRWSPR